MRSLIRYLKARRLHADLAEEMQSHLDERVDELIAAGVPPEEARLRAVRQFGNRTRLMELCRDKWGFGSLEQAAQDLRYAVRILRKSPLFTTIAVLSLGLGLAANIIIFSAVDNVLLNPLPYPESDRLFHVWSRSDSRGLDKAHVSPGDFYDWRAGRDNQSNHGSALVVQTLWGRRIRFEENQRWLTIIGVVPDIKHMGLNQEEGPVFYIPYMQKTTDWLSWATLFVRTAGEPRDFIPAARRAIRRRRQGPADRRGRYFRRLPGA